MACDGCTAALERARTALEGPAHLVLVGNTGLIRLLGCDAHLRQLARNLGHPAGHGDEPGAKPPGEPGVLGVCWLCTAMGPVDDARPVVAVAIDDGLGRVKAYIGAADPADVRLYGARLPVELGRVVFPQLAAREWAPW